MNTRSLQLLSAFVLASIVAAATPSSAQLPPVNWGKSVHTQCDNPSHPTQSVVLSGKTTAGDTLKITIKNDSMGIDKNLEYKVLSSDTLASIATNIAATINGDKVLKKKEITATVTQHSIAINSSSPNTTLSVSANTGATEGLKITSAADLQPKDSGATKETK